MYESWIQDLKDEHEFSRNYSILTGSFSNPEMAKSMLKKDEATFSSSDEDFEKSIKMIEDDIQQKEGSLRRRRRRRRQGVVNG